MFFKFKDMMPGSIQSSVIYNFTSNCFNAVYIGMTSHHLLTRFAEHIGISFRTGLTSASVKLGTMCQRNNRLVKITILIRSNLRLYPKPN